MFIYAAEMIGNEVRNFTQKLSRFLQIVLEDENDVRIDKCMEKISKYFSAFFVFGCSLCLYDLSVCVGPLCMFSLCMWVLSVFYVTCVCMFPVFVCSMCVRMFSVFVCSLCLNVPCVCMFSVFVCSLCVCVWGGVLSVFYILCVWMFPVCVLCVCVVSVFWCFLCPCVLLCMSDYCVFRCSLFLYVLCGPRPKIINYRIKKLPQTTNYKSLYCRKVPLWFSAVVE
jgi:hypothetical protein